MCTQAISISRLIFCVLLYLHNTEYLKKFKLEKQNIYKNGDKNDDISDHTKRD